MKMVFFLLSICPIAIFADHFPAHIAGLQDNFLSLHCPYFDNVASGSYWDHWKVAQPASSALSLSDVRYYGDASGTYNTSFKLASNTFTFEGYWGGLRKSAINGGGLYLLKSPEDSNSDRVEGPTCPDGSPSWVVYIFCPANTPAQNNADPFGWGGTCKRNNHRGFQSKTTGKIYLSTGLWESQ